MSVSTRTVTGHRLTSRPRLAVLLAVLASLPDLLRTVYDDLCDAAEGTAWYSDLVARGAWQRADRRLEVGTRLGEDSVAYQALEMTFTRMVSAAVTLIVGIYVFAEIADTMPTPDNTDLANATNTVEGNTGSAFQLGAVAVIVMVAVLILNMISGGFGTSGRR